MFVWYWHYRKVQEGNAEDRKMKRCDFEYLYSSKIACFKWLDRFSVTLLFSNVEGMTAKSTVPSQQKGSASKIQILCPDFIKEYKKAMGGVDLIDQRDAANQLDQKLTIRFYFRIFLDFLDVAFANSYIVFNMMHPNDLTLLYFKSIVSPYSTGRYISQSRAPADSKTGSKRKYQYQFEQGNLPPHFPEFRNIKKACKYYYKEGIDLTAYVKCTKCGIFSYMMKDRSCFKKYHFIKKTIFFKLLSYFYIIFRFLKASITFLKSKSLSLSFAYSLFFAGQKVNKSALNKIIRKDNK